MSRQYTAGGSNNGSTSLADFKQLALLGEGAYSAVYKVLRLADHEIYALKKVKLPSLSDKEKQNALNEVRLLASVRNENIIAYKEAFFDDKTRCLCIVQEMADAGDLLMQINRCRQERAYLREADVWRYLHGMCQGLKALHDLRILHRDMKCANVFLSASRDGAIAKLGDFNVSKVAKRGLCMTQTGTPYYASPEVWRDMPYDAKSDMWSLGCVLYEMVALRPPFRAEDMEGLYRKVVRGQYPRIPAHYSQDLADVIAALLQVHPRHRPSIDQFMQMPAMCRHTPGPNRDDGAVPSDLLQTIKLPKNAIDLSACLPKSRYAIAEDFNVSPQDSPANQAGGMEHGGGHLPAAPQRKQVPVNSGSAQPPRAVPHGGRRAHNPSNMDSVDAYLAQDRSEVSGAATPMVQDHHAYQQHPPLHQQLQPQHHQPSPQHQAAPHQHEDARDSLDAYLQQQHEALPPPPPPPAARIELRRRRRRILGGQQLRPLPRWQPCWPRGGLWRQPRCTHDQPALCRAPAIAPIAVSAGRWPPARCVPPAHVHLRPAAVRRGRAASSSAAPAAASPGGVAERGRRRWRT